MKKGWTHDEIMALPTENYWQVGDKLRGAGTPKLGEPYVIPTVNEQDQICDMKIVDIEMDGPRHYWGTVASITPISERVA